MLGCSSWVARRVSLKMESSRPGSLRMSLGIQTITTGYGGSCGASETASPRKARDPSPERSGPSDWYRMLAMDRRWGGLEGRKGSEGKRDVIRGSAPAQENEHR